VEATTAAAASAAASSATAAMRPGVGRQAGRGDRGGNHQRRDAGSQNPMHRGKPLALASRTPNA
jgi:hypothetical protein